MRAKIRQGALRIDLIHTPDEIADVVRLATSAGMYDITVDAKGIESSGAVTIGLPEGEFGADAFAALLSIVCEIDGVGTDQMVADWLGRTSKFRAAVEARRESTEV